jgi:dCMP deaminase
MKEKYAKALMDMACRFGETSEAQRLKVGALLYKNGAIISMGVNGQAPGWHSEVCEDSEGKTLPTVRHAEHACLEKMYLSNETTVGAYMFISHSPCLMCSLKIVAAKVEKVYYKHDYRCSEGIKYLKENGVVVFKMGEDE